MIGVNPSYYTILVSLTIDSAMAYAAYGSVYVSGWGNESVVSFTWLPEHII
jgi:hypothetical protein